MRHHLKPLRISWRFFLLVVHILCSLLLAVLFFRNLIRPDSLAARIALWWHTRLCKIFAVKKTQQGQISRQPTLFVANHISWFDIPALGSSIPVHFLAKNEINSWPIIGWLASRAGTLFIRRGSQGAAQQSQLEIYNTLKEGGHVILFPEGTTTDGTSVKRFHSRLFQAAIDARAQVQPIALQYPHTDGVHPAALFIGDTQFLESTLAIMSEPQMGVHLTFLQAIDAAHFSRDQLANMSRQQILQVIENQ
ncbi:MAG: 1-acyl-sn-glycerol-3-phosphate acyltransferase [Gammaproteobacteria bacterium]|nr:1-acyl-sn-glycerol-3-phosphate acyltransferase [Gammaproteobacteria bacterium]